MKNTKLLPLVVVIASMLLSACSGLNIPLAAPEIATTTVQTAPAAVPTANASAQSIPVSAKPAAAVPQTIADVAGLQNAYIAVFENVSPSVVKIEVSSSITGTSRSRGSGGQDSQDQVVPSGEGSGFIWDTAGHIVTNNHVVEGSAKISVTFSNGASYDAKLVGTDPNSDLAVIQVTDAPSALIKPINVADSTKVKVGQLVVAIGNPFGLANTMTTGIVSAIARSIQANPGSSRNGMAVPSFSIPDVIQTDAAINPGNSGGALVDMNGALIGVPTQIESASGSNSGIGFAVPSAIVNRVVPQLISKGTASNSYLGISGSTLSPAMVSALNLKSGQQGVLVATVAAGGPADKAGLKATVVDASGNPTAVGDIITAIEGKSITRFEDLVSYLLGSTQPEQTVTLTVVRDGKDAQVKVTLGTQPTN